MYYLKNDQISIEKSRRWGDDIKKRFDAYKDDLEKDHDLTIMFAMMSDFLGQDDDGILLFQTNQGNSIAVGLSHVAMRSAPTGPLGSEEAIKKHLELALSAKAFFEGGAAGLGGFRSDEEQQVMLYAAELVGLDIENRPENFQIETNLKSQMDQIWKNIQRELGLDSTVSMRAEMLPSQTLFQDENLRPAEIFALDPMSR